MRLRGWVFAFVLLLVVAFFLFRSSAGPSVEARLEPERVIAQQLRKTVPDASSPVVASVSPEAPVEDYSNDQDTDHSFFGFWRREYGPEVVELEGRATIDYPGYEGEFTLHFLVSPTDFKGTPGNAVFFTDAKNPAEKALGAGAMEEFGNDPVAHLMLPFNFVSQFFRLKSEEQAQQARSHSEMTTVLFEVDREKRRGSAPLEARFDYRTDGPVTRIGTVRYWPKRPRAPAG